LGLLARWSTPNGYALQKEEFSDWTPQEFHVKVTLEKVRGLAGIEEEGEKGRYEFIAGQGFEAIDPAVMGAVVDK